MFGYVGFGVWCFVTSVVGAIGGLVLGNLRLPVALLIAPGAGAASAANLVISAVTALSSTVEHLRAGRIVWKLLWIIAVPSVVGALLGGLASGVVPEQVVLGIVAVVLVLAGVKLLRKDPDADDDGDDAEHDEGSGLEKEEGARIAGGSLVIGAVGGLVGLVLGSLRTPMLLRYADQDAAKIAATNVGVGFLVSVAGTIGHLPNATPDVGLVVAGCIGAIPGGVIGARLTGRLDEKRLIRFIGVVLLIAAVGTVYEAISGTGG